MSIFLLQQLVGFSCALTCALFVSGLLRVPPLPPAEGGVRGLRRASLRRRGSLFFLLEPSLLLLGAWLAAFSCVVTERAPRLRAAYQTYRARGEAQLREAGNPAGLDVHCYWALSLLTGVLASCVALLLTEAPLLHAGAFLVGGWLPIVRVGELRKVRFAEMMRELPAAVDLVALSMNAGSDFVGALRRAAKAGRGVVADELQLVLSNIDLGMTRAKALAALEDRLPVLEVRELVRAVVLAERKGASLSETLAVLALSSRRRRSVRAEEAAARAAVLLLGPTMLLVICVLILVLGPMAVGGLGF